MRRRRAPAAAAALVIAALTFLAAGSGRAQDGAASMPSFDVLMRQFEAIAFRSEFGGAHRRGRLIKWTGPITVRLSGANAERYQSEVSAQINQLARLSGLSIRLVAESGLLQDANMVIHFVSRPDGFDREAACTTTVYDRDFTITRVEITITAHIPDLRRHCIAEETTQGLGLSNDSALVKTSIFNDWSGQQSLTPWDALMVRVLYDPRLRAGMAQAAATPLIGEIMGSLLRRPRVRQARRR
ncbi:MAG: DUF2927 domain-containing protein [Pseudomonadota bacterium]